MSNNDGAAIDLPANEACTIVLYPSGYAFIGRVCLQDATIAPFYARALNAGRDYMTALTRLSKAVAVRQSKPLDDALNLKGEELHVLQTLDEIIRVSAPLRKDIPAGIVNALKQLGFLVTDTLNLKQKEPPLTFATAGQAPIVWDMMYEGTQSEAPDYEKFWGFRIPITHWLEMNRTSRILLRSERGVFTAIHDGLPLASDELTALPTCQHCGSLSEALAQQVEQDLPVAEREGWRQTRSDDWLKQHLFQLAPTAAEREFKSRKWKTHALAEIFKPQNFHYDLLHFVCHGDSDATSAYLSKLIMRTGGETVTLEAGFIESDLRIKENRDQWNVNDPGPFVFLNACRTAEASSPDFEPPGFPKAWIENRGALAVLATICPVPDYFANAFAKRFYAFLKDRSLPRYNYLGEALLRTRRYFMEAYGNPLGLAYIVYANQDAYLDADFDL